MKRIAIATASALAIIACQVVAGIERVEKDEPTGSSDGGGDVQGARDPCFHQSPPPLPDNDDDPGGVVPPFYLAVRSLSLSARDENGYVGFDLDKVCTCDKRTSAAQGGASSCTPKTRDCDDDGGVDNKVAALFAGFAGPSGVSLDAEANDDVNKGTRNLLIYVADWNGKPNDREVYVGVMTSNGIVDPSGCGGDAGEEYYAPQWCGQDRWTYPPDLAISLKGQIVPLLREKAYVNNNTLVFRSESALTMFLGPSVVNFGSPIISGRLEPSEHGYKLNALLSGRIPIGELLAAVGQFNVRSDDDGGGKEALCDAPIFAAARKTLCDAVDISPTEAFDFKGGACNAVSSGIVFTAEPAALGGSKPTAPVTGPCTPVADDPRYTCPQ